MYEKGARGGYYKVHYLFYVLCVVVRAVRIIHQLLADEDFSDTIIGRSGHEWKGKLAKLQSLPLFHTETN